MLLEELRSVHEDLERLEVAISERYLDNPRNIRERLERDHEVAAFLDRIRSQSARGLEIYRDREGRQREVQSISTGDTFDEFYKRLRVIKEHHKRYPNQPVDNPERTYKRKFEDESAVDSMFTGEEGFGRFFDLNLLHEQYINLPGLTKRISYLQYLDSFDKFDGVQKGNKKEEYFQYINALAQYLEGFFRRTRPLENLKQVISGFEAEFDKAWEENNVEGWKDTVETQGDGIWCAVCKKEFGNDNVYKHHLSGKKHKKNMEQTQHGDTSRLKERAIAEREWRVRKFASAMQTERSDTRVNVERRQGMTDKERAQEIEALYEEDPVEEEEEVEEEKEDKIYNPLKLPEGWDGKPIPFWLYKLHGLGVEYSCEICANFVYMGRRAFDKHFSEPRHVYGLKCLGITSSPIFREITGIEEAQALWQKLQSDKVVDTLDSENVVEMEDNEGNVMPEKVYVDLQKQGLL